MEQGFIKVAAVTPKIRVADTKYNAQAICEKLEEVIDYGAKIIVFPELCITSSTCGDLFLQDVLLSAAENAVREIIDYTNGNKIVAVVGGGNSAVSDGHFCIPEEIQAAGGGVCP